MSNIFPGTRTTTKSTVRTSRCAAGKKLSFSTLYVCSCHTLEIYPLVLKNIAQFKYNSGQLLCDLP